MHPLRRFLPLLVIAQVSGILVADRGWLACELAFFLGMSALVLAFAARRSARLRAVSAAIIAFCAGAVALGTRLEAAGSAPVDGALEATIEGRVASTARRVDWMAVELSQVRNLDEGGAALPSRVRIQGPRTPPWLHALESYRPGTRIRARVRLRAPHALQNPGGRDRTRSLARRGIGATGRLVHPALHVELEQATLASPLLALETLRASASQRLQAAGHGGGLLAALALGDRSGLSSSARDSLARLGLSHLTAVSGLHVGLIAALAYAAARRVFTRLVWLAERGDARRAALVLAVCAAAAYAVLSGWGVPVRRALVFVSAVAIGAVRRQRGLPGQPLALAAMLVLAFEPGALFEAGPQMSFAASAAILAGLGGGIEASHAAGIGARIWRRVEALLRTSAAAIAATAPLAALHFGRVAPVGVLTNLIAVPLTGAVLLPLALLSALASLLRPAAPLSALVVTGSAWLAGAALRGVERLASWLPEPPPVPPLPLTALLLALALAGLVTRLRATWSRVALATAGAALLAHCPAASVLPPPPRVVVLDVGQGDAIVVQGRRATILVDGATVIPGGIDLGRSAVAPALAALGVERLDLVIASHADLDHRGGLGAVLERFPTARLWLPAGASFEPAFADLLAAAEADGIEVAEKGQGDRSEALGDLRVTPLWPPRPGGRSRNDASLVVRVDVSGSRVLLAGDIESSAEAALVSSGVDLRANVLTLPHHGSRTSATPAFLRAVSPEVAIASAPCPGRFGMPHRQVLDRADALGVPVWWTGRDGAVLVGLSPRPAVSGWAPALSRRPGCGSRSGGAR